MENGRPEWPKSDGYDTECHTECPELQSNSAMRDDDNPTREDAIAEHPGTERPSKSQRKRDMTELQQLGVRLVACKPDQLARLDLPEVLRDAILAAQRIHAHEGRRRQFQYIGRLMRDADTEAIRKAYEAMFPRARSGRRRQK